MTLSSDDVDDVRTQLDDLQQELNSLLESNNHSSLRVIRHNVDIAMGVATDLRMDLLDWEEAEEAVEMERHRSDDLGDAKLEEQRSEQ